MKTRKFNFKKAGATVMAVAMMAIPMVNEVGISGTSLVGSSITLEASATNVTIKYQAHCADIGWQNGWKSNGAIAGTVGQSRRLECLKIYLSGAGSSDKISVQTHLADLGWGKWTSANNSRQLTSGSTGQSRAIEAIRIKLSGPIAELYDISYRVHVENLGWLSWVRNGATAGTTGRALRMEAIQIKLEPKTSYKTISLGDFSTVEQWKKEVQKAEQMAVGVGKYVYDYNGNIRNYGTMIVGREAVEYKTITYYDKKTKKIKLPSKITFKLHKHKSQQTVWFDFTNLSVTQYCSCGESYRYTWEVPYP